MDSLTVLAGLLAAAVLAVGAQTVPNIFTYKTKIINNSQTIYYILIIITVRFWTFKKVCNTFTFSVPVTIIVIGASECFFCKCLNIDICYFGITDFGDDFSRNCFNNN